MKRILTKTLSVGLLGAALGIIGTVAARPALAAGPVFDSSGNGMLTGTYYFRQVIYYTFDGNGNLSQADAFNGSVVFDGAGNYSVPVGATFLDSGSGPGQTTNAITGTYSLSASGYGFMASPLRSSDTIYFMFTSGVLLGSTTENNYYDILIAAQLSSPAPTNATLQGSWSMAGFFPSGTPAGAASVFFQMNPDGAGNVGNVTIPGYIGSTGTAIQTQNSTGVKYRFSSGAAVVTFPVSSSALYFAGDEYLNFSPDGNFMFGGSPNGFDMVVGIRNPAAGTAQNFTGLYYQAGVDQDLSQYATTGFANFDTFYGSLNAVNGSVIAHERLESLFNSSALGSTFADSYPSPLTSPYNDTAALIQYAYGTNGKYRIGAGTWPFLGLNVAVQAPTLTGPGVYLNPAGVVNAASSAPFTAGISAGELIVLYGTNLAPSLVTTDLRPLPTTLGGVQVSINGIPAPIYYVSPTQVAVLVPFLVNSTYYSVAQIRLTNNSEAQPLSNVVTSFVYRTTPGVFTLTPGGLGYGALQHGADYSLITPSHPALPGETIIAYVTGLGIVSPPIQDGAVGPSDQPSYTLNSITAGTGGTVNPAVFSGLVPTVSALYQVNMTVPATATAGDATIDIGGPDSFAAEALIPIGTAPTLSARLGAATTKNDAPGQPAPRSVRVPDETRIIEAGPAIRQWAPYLSIKNLLK